MQLHYPSCYFLKYVIYLFIRGRGGGKSLKNFGLSIPYNSRDLIIVNICRKRCRPLINGKSFMIFSFIYNTHNLHTVFISTCIQCKENLSRFPETEHIFKLIWSSYNLPCGFQYIVKNVKLLTNGNRLPEWPPPPKKIHFHYTAISVTPTTK